MSNTCDNEMIISGAADDIERVLVCIAENPIFEQLKVDRKTPEAVLYFDSRWYPTTSTQSASQSRSKNRVH